MAVQFTGLAATPELAGVLEEARELARGSGQPFSSGHLLLALFEVENIAQDLLLGWEIDLDELITAFKTVRKEASERLDTIGVVHKYTAKLAENGVVSTLHMLGAICRLRNTDAFRALQLIGKDPRSLRTQVIRKLSERHVRSVGEGTALPPAGRWEERSYSDLTPPAPDRSSAALRPAAALGPSPTSDLDRVRVAAAAASAVRRPAVIVLEEADSDAPEAEDLGRYTLDPDVFPLLTALGCNLTERAALGKLDPLIGRRREVEQLVDILNKRRSNNPCLVGDPGVGKTAVVEGLAQMIVEEAAGVGALGERILIELDMGSLLAGTQLRGAFAERLAGLKEEVARMEGRVVLFIDEIHTLIGAGAGDGALDAANDLKAALARGEFPCIGATTDKEYRRYIESDPALQRRFEVVIVDEPSIEDTMAVVRGLQDHYSRFHRVSYTDEALTACVKLSERWIVDRFLPAKAIDVVDLAGASASRRRADKVTARDVARVVSQKVGVPVDRLLVSDGERLMAMEGHLCERIVAHDAAMSRVARVVRRNFAGFTTNRPMGSFLLLGPTGVGKTECARVLADFLFASRDALTRIDMSEYTDSHSVSRLIGAPPGYVGHEDGGQLTEAVRRRPYQLILFDEVEKANRDVLSILLQLLEEGQLTDGRGRRVRFQHTVVMMTSNLGHEHFDRASQRRVGFASRDAGSESAAAQAVDAALETARKAFSPELWNRIEEKLVFSPLGEEDVRRIATLLLCDSSNRLRAERNVGYTVTDDVIPHLIARGGYDERMGARPMRRTIQDLVEAVVADALLMGHVNPGDTLSLGIRDDEIAIL